MFITSKMIYDRGVSLSKHELNTLKVYINVANIAVNKCVFSLASITAAEKVMVIVQACFSQKKKTCISVAKEHNIHHGTCYARHSKHDRV